MPGTGKTASVLEVVANLRRESDNIRCPRFKFVHVNVMCMNSPGAIFLDILQQLELQYRCLGRMPTSGSRAHEELNKLLSGPCLGDETIVLLIDEVDCLLAKGQSVLYQLFEWLSLPDTHLAFVAISNTMDLPTRLLPRIHSRLAVRHVNFEPYDRAQLRQILLNRLWLARADGAFSRDALELC